jgi:histone H2B
MSRSRRKRSKSIRPGETARVAGKAVTKSSYSTGSKRKSLSFRTYILLVLKELHKDLQISTQAITVVDDLLHDIFRRLASEAGRLAIQNKKKTLKSREIQSATKLVLSGELSQHAISEGRRAVIQYIQ